MNFDSSICVKFLATVALLAYSNIGFSWEFHDCKGVGETCEAATQNAIDKCKRPAARSCGLLQKKLGDVAFKTEREQQAPGYCQVTGILIYSCVAGIRSPFTAGDLADWTFAFSQLPEDLANSVGYAFAEASNAAPGSVARRTANENAVSASIAGNFMAAANASGTVSVATSEATIVALSASANSAVVSDSLATAALAVGLASSPAPLSTLSGQNFQLFVDIEGLGRVSHSSATPPTTINCRTVDATPADPFDPNEVYEEIGDCEGPSGVQSLVVVAEAGWYVESVTGPGISSACAASGNPYVRWCTINDVGADVINVVVAKFAPIRVVVNVDLIEEGWFSSDIVAGNSVIEGAPLPGYISCYGNGGACGHFIEGQREVMLEAIPTAGYCFDHWEVNSRDRGRNEVLNIYYGTASFGGPSVSNIDVKAYFTKYPLLDVEFCPNRDP